MQSRYLIWDTLYGLDSKLLSSKLCSAAMVLYQPSAAGKPAPPRIEFRAVSRRYRQA